MAKNKITPIGMKVLISPTKIEEKTASGIYRPDAGEQKSQMGKVIAVGSGDDVTVQKGQNVLYKKYSGDEVTIDGEDYVVVMHEDILVVVE
jgi:chaperonin GroES